MLLPQPPQPANLTLHCHRSYDTRPIQSVCSITSPHKAAKAPAPLPNRPSITPGSRLIRAAGPANTFIKVSPEIAAKTLQVVNAFGANLALGLVRQIAGLGLRSDIEYLSKPVRALFAALPAQAKAW